MSKPEMSVARSSRTFDRDMASLCPPGLTPDAFAALPEAARIAVLKAAGAAPAVCGPDIPVAPARGPMGSFRPMELVPGSVGMARDTGHWQRGEDTRRRAGRLLDVFDRIEDQARATHKARSDGAGGGGAYVPPLSPAQVQIGRDYRDLTERHSAGGVRCASLETAGRSGGATGGEFIDAFVAEWRRLDALCRRIGAGVAMPIRRIRPSDSGSRRLITDRVLVDSVCLRDMDLGQVLDAQGWSAYGQVREALRRALVAALDRMMGYDLHIAQNGA